MAIIISQNGKNAKKLEPASFGLEDKLQQYIYDNPESVPVYEIREDIRLLILAREFPTNSGPIDALGVDQDGTIYVVETKLYKNPDKRLVIAQALDYGASMWRHATDFDDFSNILEAKVHQQFGIGLQSKLQDFFVLNDEAATTLIQNVRTNLSAGKFKFVVLMDQLHDRLKDLIIFINQNSQFDVYAVELEYYKHDEFEIIIPKLYGAEVKKDVKSTAGGGGRKAWTEDIFWEDAKGRLSAPQLASVQLLYESARLGADEITWGTGVTVGSFSPKYHRIGTRSFMSVYSDGHIQVSYGYLENDQDRVKLQTILSKHLTLPGITDIQPSNLAHAYPGITVDIATRNSEKLLAAIKEFIDSY
jgi:hypothetical protein